MKIKSYLIFLSLLSIFASIGKAQSEIVRYDLKKDNYLFIYPWKYKFGDQPQWANPVYNDSAWAFINDKKAANENRKDIRWYRTWITFTGEKHPYDFLMLRAYNLVSAFEFYWDGVLIYKSGEVGHDESSEKPGKLTNIIQLKNEYVSPGRHLLSVRLSNFHLDYPYSNVWIYLNYGSDFYSKLNIEQNYALFIGGIFFLVIIFSLALYFGSSLKSEYLLFAFFATVRFLASLRLVIRDNLHLNSVYLPFVEFQYADLIAYILLNWFVIYTFDFRKKQIHIIVSAVISIFLQLLLGNKFVHLGALYSSIFLVQMLWQKQSGAIPALLGIIFITSANFIPFLAKGKVPYYTYIAGQILFIFCIISAISRKLKKQTDLFEASRLRSARLETDLLKKNIQPHFIMNTLLSIISWIKKEPNVAIQQIRALADEFRMVNKISPEKEIPIEQEIQLCQAHLELMSYRMNAQYNLVTENICKDETIPPMIFHTLIENGLTHAYKSRENGTFKLSCQKENGQIRYTLTNEGSLLSKIVDKSDDEIKEGMGLKYIRARLDECYGKKWKMDYTINDDSWEFNLFIMK